MSNPSFLKSTFFFAFVVAMVAALLALPAMASSQARIVRLSDVQGAVQIDKNTGQGFERAFLNLPITQGTKLQTRDNARAEIEFEDGSTLRLTPNTTVEFTELGTSDSGRHTSVVNVNEGLVYVNWIGRNRDQFVVNFGREKVEIEREAHFRVEAGATTAEVGVFKGNLQIADPSGTVEVGKNKMASFASADDDKPVLAKLDKDPLDIWDKQSIQYHEEYVSNNSSPYGYGNSDLSYYGGYQFIPGYGLMWQPYFTGIGWDPFMDGAWSFYPGAGYMFVSAYPWGWLPYRYGSWAFVPGFGWMWQPGYWNGYVTTPRYSGTLPAGFRPPVAPKGTLNTVVVGRAGVLASSSATPGRLVVSRGSAGLGIARGSISNLGRLNAQVSKTGFADAKSAPPFAANGSRSMGGNLSAGHAGHASMGSMGAGHSGMSSASAGHASGGGGGHHN
jgi:uncharacterized protein DUF6600/FecR-like protein